MPTLYIVATPIGNLKDITLRALYILEGVDLILCEDTRVTKKLLNHHNINTPVESYHQHSNLKKIDYIKNLLKQGKNLALISDSGTPGVSDPGNKLIEIIKDVAEIVPIPGPSAVTAIASISGFPMDKFVFFGFPPHKKGRQKFFKELAEYKYPVIIYESPHRILKTLNELKQLRNFEVVIGREITKKFETVYRGKIQEVIDKIDPRGEFAIAICKKILITTPIYYVNDKPHIGHAYTTLIADVLVRFFRLQKKEVFFLTGTDEHGAKIAETAENLGITPKELCDRNSKLFKDAWKNLGIEYSYFIRTTNKEHEKTVIEFLNNLKEKKAVYEKEYKGLYCVGCEKFLTEKELENGLCPDHKTTPEKVSEKNYFFKLGDYLKKIKDLIEKDKLEIRPENAKKEVLGLFKQELDDFSISRQKEK